MLRIEIDTGNDAFAADIGPEAKRILKAIDWRRLDQFGRIKLMDANGNSVGFAEYVED